MSFWFLAAALALGAFCWLFMSLRRPAVTAAGGGGPDIAVYRAQLAELDRDLARGVVNAADAQTIRAEIARRILDSDRRTGGAVAGGASGGAGAPAAADAAEGRSAVLVAALLAIVAAAGLYLWLGNPDYPDLPRSERLANALTLRAERPTQAEAEAQADARRPPPLPADPTDEALMEKLRAAVARRPNDLEGVTLLAQNEAALGNFTAAARAEEARVKLLGDAATAWDDATLADTLVLAAGGIVTAEAEAAFRAALAKDPTNGTARFYEGLLEAQTGRPDLAFSVWNQLLADSRADAPWVPTLRQQLPLLAEAVGTEFEDPTLKGPDAGAMEAAAGMSDADRANMIAGMVGGLEARLFDKGGSAAEWAQLVTALGVLKDETRAREALRRGEAALAGDPAGLEQLGAAARAAGLAP